MTTRLRTARRVQGNVRRRTTAWDDQTITSLTASSGASQEVLLIENVADSEKRGCTLVRTLVRLTAMPSSITSVNGIQLVHFGIGLTSDDAFAAGALPDVEIDDDYPVAGWVWRDSVYVRDSTVASAGQIVRLEAELQSQRRLDRSSVFLTFSNVPVQGTPFAVSVGGIVRMLYKLP